MSKDYDIMRAEVDAMDAYDAKQQEMLAQMEWDAVDAVGFKNSNCSGIPCKTVG